jgi:carbamoyl-phosphate synthase small subunit
MLESGKPRALLVLEDGSSYPGSAFAGEGEVLGEVVFNTGMSGYQEILTDPSYKGQIVAMTCPLIGNTGINPEDMESAWIHLEGFVVREYVATPSNWRSRETLQAFLERHGKLGVEGIDTRALTRRIRITGAMRGILSTKTADVELLLERVRAYPGLVGRDLVKEVTSQTPYLWKDGARRAMPAQGRAPQGKRRVVVLDCGVKYNILRNLEQRGCEVLVLPACSPTDPAIRRPSPISWKRSGGSWERCRSSASVWGTRFWGRPLAAGPRSSSSATMGSTSRCGIARAAASRSPPRTTASSSSPNPSRRDR